MKKAQPWLVLAGVFLLMAVELRLQGRIWTCSCGYTRIWAGNINSPENSQQLFDPYSFTHILHGFIFAGLIQFLWPKIFGTWKLVAALSLEAAWEVFENTSFIIERYRAQTISLGYVGDTILNSFGDILMCTLGALLAWKLGWRKTVALSVIIEVLLLLTVRDSLLLNIIMLLYPFDAVRVWQGGH